MANVEETVLYLPQEFVTESVGFTFDVDENLFLSVYLDLSIN